jgi:hypothetical protein
MRKIFTFLAAVLLTAITNAQVGIGTTTPDASSALDLTSITKGFLIPRMTNQQRRDINTPAEGLMVYVTGVDDVVGSFMYYDGISWKDATGSDVNDPPVVGGFYQGGVVFYLLVAGDTGYVENEIHGLIAAVKDQGSEQVVNWDDDDGQAEIYTDTARGEAIGTGAANTTEIIDVLGGIAAAASYAPGLARAYRGGGFDDWFLPSKDELNEMHLKKDDINTTAAANDGSDFLNVVYWSSTQVYVTSYNNASTHDFLRGFQKIRLKSSNHRVRAVRAF